MDSYEGSASWETYRDLLAERFDIHLRHTPSETWRAVRGHDLHLDEWTPDGAPLGTLVLVHGGGGHGRVLAPFADFAASVGWRVLAPDLPGYGLTRPSPDFRWDYDEWPATVAELADGIDGPVVLFGLSVGGLTAAYAAEASRNVRGVIATTLLDMGDPALFARAARWRWIGRLSLVGFRLMPRLVDRIALPLRLAAPMRAMTSDLALQDYFHRDPLLGGMRVPSRFFRTMHRRKLGALDPGCPLLLVHPGADAWTPTELSLPAFAKVRDPKRMRELTNGSHLPAEQPARRELENEIRGFLKACLSGSLASSP